MEEDEACVSGLGQDREGQRLAAGVGPVGATGLHAAGQGERLGPHRAKKLGEKAGALGSVKSVKNTLLWLFLVGWGGG